MHREGEFEVTKEGYLLFNKSHTKLIYHHITLHHITSHCITIAAHVFYILNFKPPASVYKKEELVSCPAHMCLPGEKWPGEQHSKFLGFFPKSSKDQ